MKLWKFLCTGLWVMVLICTIGILSLEAAETGLARLWATDANGDRVSYRDYGPYSGWTAIGYTQLNDGSRKRLFWRHTDGRAGLRTLNADGSESSTFKTYGPWSGWSPADYSFNGTSARMLWNYKDGRVRIWTLDANDNWGGGYIQYGPYSGWKAVSFSEQSNRTRKRLLWQHTDGRVGLRTLNNDGTESSTFKVYGPFAGWTASDYWHDGTIGRLVWNHTDGRVIVYTLDANDNEIVSLRKNYGPWPPTIWTARAYHGVTGGGWASGTLKTVSQQTLVVKKAGSGSGTITAGTQVCDVACAELTITYIAGKQVDVTVTPTAGSYFAGWETAGGVQIENIYYAEPGDTVFAIFEQK